MKDIKNPKASCCPTPPPPHTLTGSNTSGQKPSLPPAPLSELEKLLKQQLTANTQRDISQPPRARLAAAGPPRPFLTGIKPQPKTERRESKSFPLEKIRRSQGVGTLGVMEAEGGAQAEKLVRKAKLNTRATSCGLVCPTPSYTQQALSSQKSTGFLSDPWHPKAGPSRTDAFCPEPL